MSFSYYLNRSLERTFGLLAKIIEGSIFRNTEIKIPPIIVIGPARSGTTLAYQCLVNNFRVCYLNNLTARFRFFPSTIGFFSSFIGGCSATIDFKSNYGKTEGWNSPSQGNRIWGRWFKGRGPGQMVSASSARDVRRIISTLEGRYDVPFVTKWPGFSVYLDRVEEVIGDAVFVRISRNPLEIVPSILKGRRDLRGEERLSISRLPSSYSMFENHSSLEQVAAYVLGVEKDIDVSMDKIGRNRFFTINYEELCNNPDLIMDRFGDFYSHISGIELQRIRRIGKCFTVSQKKRYVEEEAVEKLYQELKSKYFV